MSLSVDSSKFVGNLHPEPFPGSQLIADLTHFSASKLKRQDVDLIVFAERRRADNRTSEAFHMPGHVQLAAVGIHAPQHETFIFELNP